MNQKPLPTEPLVKKGKTNGLKKLIREVVSDDEEIPPVGSILGTTGSANQVEPWRADFVAYMDSIEASWPANMSIIQWWGVSIHLSIQTIMQLLIYSM